MNTFRSGKDDWQLKLKENFVTQEIDGEQVMVAVGGGFNGMVRSNATASFIVDCLKTETTPEAVLDAMCRQYDAPREVMVFGIEKVLNQLRGIGALDE